MWPDNWRAEHVYDALNRLTEVRGGAPGAVATLARYQYDARSRRTSAAFGPALGAPVSSIAYAWEIDNDLDTLTHVFNGASVVFDHGYDGSGRLTSTAVSDDAWLWRPDVASSEGFAYSGAETGSLVTAPTASCPCHAFGLAMRVVMRSAPPRSGRPHAPAPADARHRPAPD